MTVQRRLGAFLSSAALLCGVARATAPSYTLQGIVNAGNYAAGPFAPNSILTIFGTGLARSSQQLTAGDIQSGRMPTELNYTEVFVDNYPAPLFYVSDSQINFLVPSNQSLGPMKIRVASEGNSGPEITVTVVDAAPALFTWTPGYAIATHVDNSLITADSPAHAGEIVVIYATGLGKTAPNPATGEIPQYAAQIAALSSFQVLLGGVAVDRGLIKYAGLTPESAGLYQINLEVPGNAGTDPEIRLAASGQTSASGLKLAIR
ncbi:MAG TPA: IPT/TIG domain-containing protein [Bryobacteraceae bacterium]|nr:IPT/TIG domain-containing protein [Bryobacteraceae bacterium]